MTYTAPSVTASGTTFAQFQSGGASGHLELLIAAQVASVAPTAAPTLAASGSGATLPAATYYVVVTESNGFGETAASPVSAAQAVTLGQTLTVTFPSLKTGNTSRNTYVGTAVGGPWLLAATGTTASTVAISAPLPSNSFAGASPTVSSTGLTFTDKSGNVDNIALVLLRGAKDGNVQDAYNYLGRVIEEFNSGHGNSFSGTINKLRRCAHRFRHAQHAMQ